MGLSKRIFIQEVERAQYLTQLMHRATVPEILDAMRRMRKNDDNEKNNASKVRGITPTAQDQ